MAVISLLRPPLLTSKWAYITSLCPPIGLAYIASSLLRDNHQVQVIDGIGENPLNTFSDYRESLQFHGLSVDDIVSRIHPKTTIVGITCMFSFEWPVVKNLLKCIKKYFPHVIIVMGGEHGTAMPEFCLRESKYLNYIVLGEGENTICELVTTITKKERPVSDIAGIAYLDGDKFKRTTSRKRIIDINSIPEPAWNLIPLENYLKNGLGFGVNRGKSMPIIASRGCPYRCAFCSSHSMWTTRYLSRTPESVIAEIKKYVEKYSVTNVDFYDLTAIIKKKWIIEFCKLLIKSNLQITLQLPAGTRSEALDDEVMQLFYKAGCRNLVYAPESGSKKVLNEIKKNINLLNIKKSMRSCVKSGIKSKVNIMVGFPQETKKDVFQNLFFLIELAFFGIDDITISPFTPYPGSELFVLLQKSHRIPKLNDDYFYSLLSIADLKNNICYSEHYSNTFFFYAQSIGYLVFYGLSFSIRPIRFARLLKNISTNKHETRLEKALSNLFFRILNWKKMIE